MKKRNGKQKQPHNNTICNRWRWLVRVLVGLVCVITLPAFASTPSVMSLQSTKQTNNVIVNNTINQNHLTNQAKHWGLTTVAFKRYLWLMNNTPSGHWYRQLDPAEVLALNAKDPDEMMKYAKIQARNMHVRVTRELAFDQLYTKTYKQLYPTEKPIRSPQNNTLNTANLQSGDRIWLFVGINTPLGGFAYQHVMKVVEETPGTGLDIYFVGKHITQQQIQHWAMSAGIPRRLVKTQVTLNYGNDRFESVTKGQSVNLPYVGVLHDDHFQPITLSSVL